MPQEPLNRLHDLVLTHQTPHYDPSVATYVHDLLARKPLNPYEVVNQQAWQVRDAGQGGQVLDAVVLDVLARMEKS